MKKETVFYGLAKYASVLASVVVTSVLSRILAPMEFGVVSVTAVFTAFFSVLADMGLGAAVIQKRALTQEQTRDLFGLSVWIALALGVLFDLLGVPVSLFYGDNVYRRICALLSLSVVFNALNIVPNALLMKAKRFRLAGLRLVSVSVITGASAVLMARAGCSYYALVAQSVLQAALVFLWNFLTSGLRPTLHTHRESVKLVLDFSSFQFAYNLANYFARNLDNLLIGKLMGPESLAYYDKGYRLMIYPVQNLTYVINPVVHPLLAEHQEDKRYIYDAYMRLVRILSLAGVFIAVFCLWGSREIVLLFFGSQWEQSIPVFRFLSLSIWPQIVSASAGSVYQSTGNTRLLFKSGMIHFSLSIALIALGVMTGKLYIAALLVSVAQYMRFFVDYYFLVVKNFGYRYGCFLKEFRYDVLIAAGLLTVTFVLRGLSTRYVLATILVKGGLLFTVYLGLLLATGQLRVAVRILKGTGDPRGQPS